LCKNATAALDEYPPDLESTRVDEESLEESRELLFSDQATFTKLDIKISIRKLFLWLSHREKVLYYFYKITFKSMNKQLSLSVFTKLDMEISIR